MPDISIFLGGIRPKLWERLYRSIQGSVGKYSFELVICGPFSPTSFFKNIGNFKYIRDFGSVARGAQIAALYSEGNLLSLGADDGIYTPGKLDEACSLWYAINKEKGIVPLRYGEGGNIMQDNYWHMKKWQHFNLIGIPDQAPMMLNSVISRKLFYEIGGYDCVLFNTCNWGGQDLTIRLVNYGCDFLTPVGPVMMCDWAPGSAGMYGDHDPVTEVDDMQKPGSDYEKLFHLYGQKSSRTCIDFSNWKLAESVWSKRFK